MRSLLNTYLQEYSLQRTERPMVPFSPEMLKFSQATEHLLAVKTLTTLDLEMLSSYIWELQRAKSEASTPCT